MLTRLISWFRRYVRRRGGQKIKTIFLLSGIFPRKADSVIFLVFECTINPQNLMKIVGTVFEKMKILIFFLCELPLMLRVDRKRKKWAKDICRGNLGIECERDRTVGLGATLGGNLKKTARDIYKRTVDVEFERDRSIGLGSTIGDGQTDRQTHTHTHTHTFFQKQIFRLWEWCRIKNHKKKLGEKN